MSTTDTERDERLRKARDWAERLRESLPRLPGGPTAFEETVLALAAEVTRLDAVVTAQAEAIRIYERRIASAESYDGWDL